MWGIITNHRVNEMIYLICTFSAIINKPNAVGYLNKSVVYNLFKLIENIFIYLPPKTFWIRNYIKVIEILSFADDDIIN